MMPAAANAKGAWTGGHNRQGFAANFDAAATVHVPSMCDVYYLGCKTEGAANYDPHATVDDFCYIKLSGCLDNEALNFGCPAPGINLCPNGIVDRSPEQITEHAPWTCTMAYSPPPPPPVPLAPPLTVFTVEAHTTVVTVPVTGTEPPTKSEIENVKATAESKTACASAGKCTIEVSVVEIATGLTIVVTTTTTSRRRLAEAKYMIKIIIRSATAEDNAAVQTQMDSTVTGSVEAIQAYMGSSVTAGSVAATRPRAAAVCLVTV
jgi:hypothetical protein